MPCNAGFIGVRPNLLMSGVDSGNEKCLWRISWPSGYFVARVNFWTTWAAGDGFLSALVTSHSVGTIRSLPLRKLFCHWRVPNRIRVFIILALTAHITEACQLNTRSNLNHTSPSLLRRTESSTETRRTLDYIRLDVRVAEAADSR